MRWRKQGLIYAPKANLPWARTHAFNPTIEIVDERTLRVYFAALDEQQFGRIGFVELDAKEPSVLRRIASEPILDIGERGCFDDSGVNPSCVISIGGQKFLYYIGWQRAEQVPYMLFTGLAIAKDESGFTRHSRVPILDRTAAEPFSRAALFVLKEDQGYRGWYWSCEKWSNDDGWIHYNNVIRTVESPDGVVWNNSRVCLRASGPDDYTLGRPWVVRESDVYKMWYGIRSRARISYRLGYAESSDGVNWERKDDEVGISPSTVGWDSEMICCPCVVDVQGKRYLFYNGNRHGAEGFGYAVLDE